MNRQRLASSARSAIYSGTFDPVTLGHLDLIHRAASLFERLVVAVAVAHHKKTLFSLPERMALLQASLSGQAHIEVVSFNGLVVDCCRQVGASAIVRGIRNGSDMDYESQMAQMNRKLAPAVETLFMLPTPGVQCISSTLVREISALGGDVTQLVSPAVLDALQAKRAATKA
jgi:pantetheine-phosphate adenylyltransferase